MNTTLINLFLLLIIITINTLLILHIFLLSFLKTSNNNSKCLTHILTSTIIDSLKHFHNLLRNILEIPLQTNLHFNRFLKCIIHIKTQYLSLMLQILICNLQESKHPLPNIILKYFLILKSQRCKVTFKATITN